MLHLLKPLSLRRMRRSSLVNEIKTSIHSSLLTEFFLSIMASLRKKRKLGAVSRETPESTTKSRSQNTLDPELAQEFISQVSEKIEGRVTRKLSKKFSRTESRILGVLSKLDDFLLNPQVRPCSVTVPGTFRNSNSENREPTGDRSLDDPCPEVRFSSHHSGNPDSSEVEEYTHNWSSPNFFILQKTASYFNFCSLWHSLQWPCHFPILFC